MTISLFQNRWMRAVALALVVVKLWFVTAQPMVVVAGAFHDERLFFIKAEKILIGHWLGAYDQMTLAKGIGYPVFIAGSFLLGLPLPLAEHLFYIVACWLLVRALRPLWHHDGWALLLFAGLLWQPMSYVMPPPLTMTGSIMRQNIYTPLTMLIFAALIALHTRRTAGPWVRAGWALAGGVSAGWLWLTREETIWIVPAVVLLLVVALVGLIRSTRRWPRALWPYGLAVATAVTPVAGVSTINAIWYGWFGTCEFHAPEFIDAYAALTRVRVGEPISRIPVTGAARQAIYDVSPAFAQLRESIEDTMRPRWASSPVGEFTGGMWMWALRDAVVETIHPRNAREALDFYARIANEVNAACDDGRLPAGPRHHSFLPDWQPHYTDDLLHSFLPFGRVFVFFEGFNARPSPSYTHGAPDLMLLFRDLGRWPITASEDVPAPETPQSKRFNAWRTGALQSIGNVVRWLVIAAILLAVPAWLGLAAHALRRKTAPGYLWWVASAAAGGAFCVYFVALLVYVTSWPDTRPLRFAQGYPLLVLFAGATAIDWIPRVPWHRFRLRRNGTSPDEPRAT